MNLVSGNTTFLGTIWPSLRKKRTYDILYYITGHRRNDDLADTLRHHPTYLFVRYFLIQLYCSKDILCLHRPAIVYW